MARVCIYHNSCTDGFGAAWVFKRYCFLNNIPLDKVVFLACNYNEDWEKLYKIREVVQYNDVVVFDFSFPRELMIELNSLATNFQVFDHHKTAQAACEGLDFCHFDMARSGAMLAWMYLFPNDSPDDFIKYIQDYDLWQHKLPYSESISAAIHSYERTFDNFDYIRLRLEQDRKTLIEEGRAILRLEDKQIKDAVKNAVTLKIAEYEIKAVNNPVLISKTAASLGADAPFGAAFFMRDDYKWVISLRANGANGVDVSAIAKSYGGGGHKAAAGFVIDDIRKLIPNKINNQTSLITAPDEQQRCCILFPNNKRCENKIKYFVGKNHIDDYTYVCESHLETVKRGGDTVTTITD